MTGERKSLEQSGLFQNSYSIFDTFQVQKSYDTTDIRINQMKSEVKNILKKYNFQLTLLVGVFSYLIIAYVSFISPNPIREFPSLRARLGTILWHSSDRTTSPNLTTREIHIYCYYPSKDADYTNKGGEYLLKRVSVLEDCSQWHGAVFLEEDEWVSEREKIWWSDQNVAEDNHPHIENPASLGQV